MVPTVKEFREYLKRLEQSHDLKIYRNDKVKDKRVLVIALLCDLKECWRLNDDINTKYGTNVILKFRYDQQHKAYDVRAVWKEE